MIKRYSKYLALAVVPVLFVGCEDDYNFTEPTRTFTVSPVFIGIDDGTSVQLTASDVSGNPITVNWSSDNTAVATVNASGMVSARGAGITSIIARHPTDANQIASSSITVNALQGIALTKGVPVPNLTGAARGNTRLYRIFVPAGTTNLTVTLSGGSGDADLYLSRGQPPVGGDGDACIAERAGNNELCSISNPQSGTWYIAVITYDPYSGATLLANYTP